MRVRGYVTTSDFFLSVLITLIGSFLIASFCL